VNNRIDKAAGKRPRNLIRSRFKLSRLPEVEAFTASLPFDRRLFHHDIRGSIAHARMLAKTGLVSKAQADRMIKGLKRIEREIEAGDFIFDPADEDIHLAIERRLTEIAGAAGARLHAARSRNDQVVLDLRMYLADEIAVVLGLLDRLKDSLIAVAEAHVETVMPGYTHLQRAQPVSLAHHVLAYIEMFSRDRERFAQTRERVRVMPLGAGALAATTLPIDRRAVAQELGFPRLTENSMDAVSDRDFAADFIFAAALCGVHISRMSEDIILWATAEFGFLQLPDEFSTGSSMMPQKKNPDLLELFRGKTGRLVGDLTALLTTLKGLPMAYNSDLQEDKERVFDALDTLKPMLDLMAKLWPRMTFDTQRMRAAAGDGALATDIAEELVSRGLPFRSAHEIVGRLVREAAAAGKRLEDLSDMELQRHCGAHAGSVRRRLSAEESLRRRQVIGGPSPAMVRRRLAQLKRQ